MELLIVEFGVRAGLDTALLDAGPATAGVLAGRAGIAARCAGEWLAQPAAAGFVVVHRPGGPVRRRYLLPDGHAEALLGVESLHPRAEPPPNPQAAPTRGRRPAIVGFTRRRRRG